VHSTEYSVVILLLLLLLLLIGVMMLTMTMIMICLQSERVAVKRHGALRPIRPAPPAWRTHKKPPLRPSPTLLEPKWSVAYYDLDVDLDLDSSRNRNALRHMLMPSVAACPLLSRLSNPS